MRRSSQGPVVYPRSAVCEMSANSGCQLSCDAGGVLFNVDRSSPVSKVSSLPTAGTSYLQSGLTVISGTAERQTPRGYPLPDREDAVR